MKRRNPACLCVLLLFALLLCAAAEAETYSGQCGYECEMTWTLTDGGRLDIGGEGSMQDYPDEDDVPWKDYRDQITLVAMGEGVESIGCNAFRGCSNLMRVDIPESVTVIRDSAFRGCTSLPYVFLPSTVTSIGSSAFEGCGNLAGVAIPAGMTAIGARAFRDCANLDGIAIPAGVAQIGDSIFYGCSRLADVSISAGVTQIGDSAFYGCSRLERIVIPYGVTDIGSSAFEGCGNLRYVTIPASVTEICDAAFRDCIYLETMSYGGTQEMWEAVTIDPGNDYLIQGTFVWGGTVAGGECGAEPHTVFWTLSRDGALNVAGSGNMKNYDPDGDTPPWYALRERVTSVTVESGVRTIGNSAFSGCIQLESVSIDRGLTSVGSEAFLGCIRLEAVNIQGGVTSVGSGAFQGCASLTGFAVPVGVEEIRSYAFDGCTGLQSVTIPLGVTAIGEYAFNGCAELTAVSIPITVAEIGECAFNGCTDLAVRYDGTGEMWRAIRIGGSNDPLSNSGIQYGCTVACGECGADGCTVLWTLSGNGALFIAGDGDMREFGYENNSDAPWYEYLEDIRSVAIGSGVTSIGQSAFFNCKNLESIDIPDSVTEIGESAVRNCSSLISVTIPAGVTIIRHCVFECCGSLESLTIPAGVTTIEDHAFGSCGNLESVTIPVGVTKISDFSFVSCVSLKSVTIPASVREIRSNAFAYCFNLESVTIPAGVSEISSSLFDSCTNLESVSIPASVTEIRNDVFKSCEKLSHIWYDGSMEMWNSIEIHDSNDDLLRNVELHCRLAVSIECGAGGTVKADKTITDGGKTVTLTVKPAGVYVLDSLTAVFLNSGGNTVSLEQDTADPDKWTFTMPYADVKVTAVFALNSAFAPTIRTQDLSLTYGYLSGCVSVTAAAAEEHEITAWQWYSCDDRNKTNPVLIEGATGAELDLPAGMGAGTAYYFCAVTATRTDNGQSATAESDVAAVTVGRAEASVTPDAKVRIVGKKDPPLTATVTGMIGGDTLNYTLARDEGEDEGVYGIQVAMGDNPNYEVTVNSGTFTIVPPFSGNFILPKNTKTIGESAFEGLTEITGVDAGSCETIGGNAFRGCTGLLCIRVSKACDIDDTAFDGCDSLIAVYGPGGGNAEQSAGRLGIPFADEAGE